ncbi:MAG: hypothetical protein V7K98_04055 [Nostoc sp.]
MYILRNGEEAEGLGAEEAGRKEITLHAQCPMPNSQFPIQQTYFN